MAAPRLDLFKEVIAMAFDTVRTNKMRSGLTVLGIVIGITAIVGMTSLIMGFDRSMRDLFATIGPNTIFIQRFGITDFANGAEIRDLLKRPNLTVSDARAIEQQATTLQYVDIELGAGVGPATQRTGSAPWPAGSSERRRPATTSWSWSPRWATPPTTSWRWPGRSRPAPTPASWTCS